MNTKSIYTVGKCLLLLLLIFTGYACEDNDEGKENTSAPVLISCNINGTEVDLANIDSETENNLTAGLMVMWSLSLAKPCARLRRLRMKKPVKC